MALAPNTTFSRVFGTFGPHHMALGSDYTFRKKNLKYEQNKTDFESIELCSKKT